MNKLSIAGFQQKFKFTFRRRISFLFLCFGLIFYSVPPAWGETALKSQTVPFFSCQPSSAQLTRLAQPGTPFVQTGQKFAFIGEEGGSFEAWAYPLKLCREFKFSFFVQEATRPLEGKDLVQSISVVPEAVTLRFVYQSFTVEAIYFSPPHLPAGFILLQVETTVPLKIVCSFIPVLQPMWPAGLGGQYSYWDKNLHAYVISEPTGKNHAFIGSPTASGISYTPAHMLSDSPNEFVLEISPQESGPKAYWPIIITGGKGKREDFASIFQTAPSKIKTYYLETVEYWRSFLKKTLSLTCPEEKLNQAFIWSKLSLAKLLVNNPDLGQGLVAGLGPSGSSGRPGFGWFFSGDAYINSLGLTAAGAFPLVKKALAFTLKWQRADGKMAHELSQAAAYLNWWQDYPYGYIHADTTPYFLVALENYVTQSGDLNFLHQCWPAAVKAFRFCLATDKNKDGLMDNRQAGLGALEYGALTDIQTDIYLAAIWLRALQAMEKMATFMKKENLAQQARSILRQAKETYLRCFWNQEEKFFAYAFNPQGHQVKEISPWNTLGIMWNWGKPEQRTASLKRLLRADMLTDWGIRSLSNQSSLYGPLNYNYGAVWPFLNGWLTMALYGQHLSFQATTLLKSTAALTFEHTLGAITEVYSGTLHIWPQEAVPLQGFSSHALLFPFIQGLLGLQGSALKKEITFHPQLPADWSEIKINNFQVGSASFNLYLQRKRNSLIITLTHSKASGYHLTIAPCFSRGTRIKQITVDNHPITFQIHEENQVIWPEAKIVLTTNSHLIRVDFEPTLEIIPAWPELTLGAKNQGLKIIDLEFQPKKIIIEAQGRPGGKYQLKLINQQKIKSLEGASLKNSSLVISFPPAPDEKFITKLIKIYLK